MRNAETNVKVRTKNVEIAMRMSLTFCRRVLALALILMVVPTWSASAFMHQDSRIRFEEHSPALFARARQEGKPVFLLISAVWCYWCKHFEQNTLKAEQVSAYLNASYVSAFGDYDRRPDLVSRYARGLPMVVLFSPDGGVRQSFAGALTKEDFLSVLRRVERDIRAELAKGPPAADAAKPSPSLALAVSPKAYSRLLDGLARYLDEQLDATHGGFGVGSKAPHGRLLALLLEQPAITGDRRRVAALEKTLDGILQGLYDPVDGGFFHYATGRDWSDPRYEKMLYVNAALTTVLDRAHRLTGNLRYREAADATIAYVLRTFYDTRHGGFFNSQTADPAYYRLSREQRRTTQRPPVNRDKIAAANAETIMAFLALSQSTGRQDLKEAAFRSLAFVRRELLTDSGVYHIHDAKTGRGQLLGQLEANAWATLAFLEAYRVSKNRMYQQAAERVLRYALVELFDLTRGAFVDARDRQEPRREGDIPLEANGAMALALLRGHQASGRPEYLETARRVLATLGRDVQTVLTGDAETTSPRQIAATTFYLRAYGEAVQPRAINR